MSRASGARITLASYEEMLGGSPREQNWTSASSSHIPTTPLPYIKESVWSR